MEVRIVEGDLLKQETDAIVNAWNRNVIPWWLLLPQGVSGAIKRRAGVQPFRELARLGPIPLGGAVHTGAGQLPYQAIIHVAGINLWWRASRASIQDSVRNAVRVAESLDVRSLAFPIIGAGSGGFDAAEAERLMLNEFASLASEIGVVVVRYRPKRSRG